MSCSTTITTGTTEVFYKGQDSQTDRNIVIWNSEVGLWEGQSSLDKDREGLRDLATYNNRYCKQVLVPFVSPLINLFIISCIQVCIQSTDIS